MASKVVQTSEKMGNHGAEGMNGSEPERVGGSGELGVRLATLALQLEKAQITPDEDMRIVGLRIALNMIVEIAQQLERDGHQLVQLLEDTQAENSALLHKIEEHLLVEFRIGELVKLLRAELAEYDERYQAEVTELRAMVERVIQERDSLQAELASNSDEHHRALAALAVAQSRVAELEATHRQLLEQANRARTRQAAVAAAQHERADRAEAGLEELRLQYAQVVEEKDGLQAQLEALRARVSEQQERRASQMDENVDSAGPGELATSEKLLASQARVAELEETVAALEETGRSLRGVIRRATSQETTKGKADTRLTREERKQETRQAQLLKKHFILTLAGDESLLKWHRNKKELLEALINVGFTGEVAVRVLDSLLNEQDPCITLEKAEDNSMRVRIVITPAGKRFVQQQLTLIRTGLVAGSPDGY